MGALREVGLNIFQETEKKVHDDDQQSFLRHMSQYI